MFPTFSRDLQAAGGRDSPGGKEVFDRADRQWKKITRLPILCNLMAWQAAAVAAGYPAPDLDKLDLEKAEWMIRSWACALAAERRRKQRRGNGGGSSTPDKAPGVEDHGDEAILDRLADILTSDGYRIVKFLWGRKYSTTYETLADKCWRNVPTDAAINTALKRVAGRLNTHTDLGIEIEIAHSKRRVKLNRLSNKLGANRGLAGSGR